MAYHKGFEIIKSGDYWLVYDRTGREGLLRFTSYEGALDWIGQLVIEV